MESNSESPIIIQMLKNVKQIIDVSKQRGCWKDEELKEIGITSLASWLATHVRRVA